MIDIVEITAFVYRTNTFRYARSTLREDMHTHKSSTQKGTVATMTNMRAVVIVCLKPSSTFAIKYGSFVLEYVVRVI